MDGEGGIRATVAEVVHGGGERLEKDSEAGRGRAGTGGGDQGGVVGAEVFMEVRVRAIEKSVHELRQIELQVATKKVSWFVLNHWTKFAVKFERHYVYTVHLAERAND